MIIKYTQSQNGIGPAVVQSDQDIFPDMLRSNQQHHVEKSICMILLRIFMKEIGTRGKCPRNMELDATTCVSMARKVQLL